METFSLLDKLKESIQCDLRVLEEKCDKAQEKICCLEQENSAAKELNTDLQRENASLRENLAGLRKELAYKDEKLKRKSEEFRTRDKWWNRYRLMSERRYTAMKDHGTFPAHILEKFVNRDIDEQMHDIPNEWSPFKENELHKKHKNLSTLKGRRRVRYNRLSNGNEKKDGDSVAECSRVCRTSITNDASLVEDDDILFSDPNESTKLYQDFVEKQDIEKPSAVGESAVSSKISELKAEDVHNPHERQEMKGSVFNDESFLPKLDLEAEPQSAKVSISCGESVRPRPDTDHMRYPSQQSDTKASIAKRLAAHQNVFAPDSEDVPSSPNQHDAEVSVCNRVSVCPEVLVPDTEDVFPEEAGVGLHCTIGAPSASSTPVAAANSPLFGFDNDHDDENDVGVDILGDAASCDDTVSLLTAAKTQLSNLPKSDSQFPVDLSLTQPQSPTIPSRTRSLQQDLDLSADCSVSLLPHGVRCENKSNTDLKIGAVKDNDDTVFVDNRMDNLQKHTKRGDEIKNPRKKISKQTTLDAKVMKAKENYGKKDLTSNVSKRKRENSDDNDNFVWPGERNIEKQSETVFKVPELLPPKTPEVILLKEFPPHVAGRKSCTTPLSGGEDMDQSADLFGNMDDARSPVKEDEKLKEPSLEKTDKENVPKKNPANKPSYKYIEVVRKRDERAKLNGYDCRECQQYYQGLELPEEELKKRLKHCSRHRARFSPPPSTPPGFWNLSFPNTQEYMDKGYLKTESQAPAPKRLRRARRNKIAK